MEFLSLLVVHDGICCFAEYPRPSLNVRTNLFVPSWRWVDEGGDGDDGPRRRPRMNL